MHSTMGCNQYLNLNNTTKDAYVKKKVIKVKLMKKWIL
jgi:hypothetical protein